MKEGNGKRSRTQGEERTTEDIEREGKAVYVEVCNILQSCHEHHGVEPGTEAEVYRIEIHVPLKPGMLVPWTLVVGGFTCLLHVPSLPWNDSDICSSSTRSRDLRSSYFPCAARRGAARGSRNRSRFRRSGDGVTHSKPGRLEQASFFRALLWPRWDGSRCWSGSHQVPWKPI